MSDNIKPENTDRNLELPVAAGHDQELDEASLDEVTGGGTNERVIQTTSKIMANSHEMKKAIIGNLPR